jgi:hypothetical protein
VYVSVKREPQYVNVASTKGASDDVANQPGRHDSPGGASDKKNIHEYVEVDLLSDQEWLERQQKDNAIEGRDTGRYVVGQETAVFSTDRHEKGYDAHRAATNNNHRADDERPHADVPDVETSVDRHRHVSVPTRAILGKQVDIYKIITIVLAVVVAVLAVIVGVMAWAVAHPECACAGCPEITTTVVTTDVTTDVTTTWASTTLKTPSTALITESTTTFDTTTTTIATSTADDLELFTTLLDDLPTDVVIAVRNDDVTVVRRGN